MGYVPTRGHDTHSAFKTRIVSLHCDEAMIPNSPAERRRTCGDTNAETPMRGHNTYFVDQMSIVSPYSSVLLNAIVSS